MFVKTDRKIKIILISIVFFAGILRFYKLGNNPPSLTWDEAAWGYNAYSLGLNGKDEFGRFLPIDFLESFGDYKPPVYAYLTVLPVKIFGMNEFAVRFPSAFFGALTVLITYFLVIEIFRSKKKKARIKIALLSAGLLAISPWHINLSRAAFEANLAQFFIVAGVYFFLRFINNNSHSVFYLLSSVFFFVVSLYTFNTARVVSPLLVLMLAVGFHRYLWRMKKQVIVAALLGLFLSVPFIRFMLTPQAKLRYHEVNIFSDLSIIQTSNQEIANDNNRWYSRILHNRRWGYLRSYLKHYFDNFNPAFLFIKGDGNPKFSTQDIGQLYLWSLPFLVIGALYLVRKKEGRWWIIPIWLLLGIVPAATARETPHALRIETTLPTWQIMTAYGYISLSSKLKIQNSKVKLKSKKFLFQILLVILLFANFIYYLHGYYSHYPIEYSGEWQYGYKEAVSYTESVKDKYDKIVFTKNLGRPYIYVLFYAKYNPRFFQDTAQVKREVFGFVHVNGFGKYVFSKNPNSIKPANKKVLYINTPQYVPDNADIKKNFKLLNGQTVLTAYSI